MKPKGGRGTVVFGGLAVMAGLAVVAATGVLAAVLFLVPTTSSTDPVASGADPALSATGGFDAVRAAGRLVVAADPKAPPFLSGADGGYEGFEYALMATIADAAGATLEIRPTPYDDLLDAVANGAVDAAIGQLPPVPHPDVAYTRSYLQYNLCLTVAPGSRVRSLVDLRSRTIGMYDDLTAKTAVNAVLGSAWNAKTYGDYGYFQDLAGGRIDAVVYDCPLTRYELQKGGVKLDIVDSRLAVATYSIAVPASRAPLRADIDRVLGELGANGLLQQLSTRWLGETPAQDAPAADIAVVRGGETLEQVAGRALGDPGRVAELLEWNRDILGNDPKAVYGGMQLRVR
ncbi:MAG: ABC transporter substrate-binding protein [Myxococcota bacterium]